MPASLPLAPTVTDLRHIIADIVELDPEAIDADANLVMLGISSLDTMRLITRWRRLGVQLRLGDLVADPTIEAWHQHLLTAWDVAAATAAGLHAATDTTTAATERIA